MNPIISTKSAPLELESFLQKKKLALELAKVLTEKYEKRQVVMDQIGENLRLIGEHEQQKADEEERKKKETHVDKYAAFKKKNLNLFIESNNEKLIRIKDQRSILHALKLNYRENHSACQKKIDKIQQLQDFSRYCIVRNHSEIGQILFNPLNIGIFRGYKFIDKSFENFISCQNHEEEMNICLGYIVLLLNKMGKYLNMSYRYPMAFRGSRSVIMKFKGESLALYIIRMTDRGKSGFEAALRHLHINIFQLLMSITQGKVEKTKRMDYIIQCFINYLYLNSLGLKILKKEDYDF